MPSRQALAPAPSRRAFLRRSTAACPRKGTATIWRLQYDMVTRQGISNMIEKVVKLGAETVMRKAESYMADVQLWFR